MTSQNIQRRNQKSNQGRITPRSPHEACSFIHSYLFISTTVDKTQVYNRAKIKQKAQLSPRDRAMRRVN